MVSADILLRNRGDIVGFGKYVLDPDSRKPTEVIHGHRLDQFARESEHLVAIHSVQIFTEFEAQPYPYEFKGFDDPPVLLGDLNVLEKAFKTIIAWDGHKIAPNPRPSLATLGSLPRTVSVDFLGPIRQSISNSPVKVRFACDLDISKDGSHQASRQSSQMGGNRSAFREIGSARSIGILESLPDVHDDHHDDNTISDQTFDEIESQILFGRFDESIDQFAEEAKAEEERENRRRAQPHSAAGSHSKDNSRTRCNSRASASDAQLPSDSKRHTSTAERIVKRLRGNSERVRGNSAQNRHSSCNLRGHRGNAQHSRGASGCTQHTDPAEPSTDAEMDYTGTHGAPQGDLGRIVNAESTQSLEFERSLRQTVAGSLLTVQPSLVHTLHEAAHDVLIKKRQYRFKTRQRAQKKTMGRRRAARMEMVQNTMHKNPFHHPRVCCNAGCFYLVDPEYAVVQYRRFLQMDREDRKRALKNMYIQRAGAFWFGGAYVCTRFLSRGLQFSNQLQCAVKGTPKARASSSIVAIPRRNMKETKKNQIILYLRDLSERIGDSLPTKPHNNLPLMSKKQVFEKFETFNRNVEGRETPSLSYWCDVWKKFCSDIKTHRRHGFTVCDTCEKIRVGFETAENERVEAVLRKELAAHYEFVERERRDYEKRRELSKRYPTKYLSLIVDGADQTSYGLPHFVFATKEDRGEKIKMKIVGVLEHGMQKQLTLLTLTDDFESGANHVIEALHRVLARTKAKRGKLPPVLFVQADNCTRENKNRFLLSYLELLVQKGVFEEVQLCFLPIGHTHADIDQAFSSVATRLKLERAITDIELLNLMRHCYNPRAYAEAMEEIANFSGLCVRTGCIRNVVGFTPFRFFRITRKLSISGVTEHEGDHFVTTCDVKIQCTDQWAPLDNSLERAGFLKFAPDLNETPMTDTTPPENVLAVNKHLRSCEHRVNSVEKMKRLEALRDRIYTRRKQNFHWNLSLAIEEMGDYRPGSGLEGEAEVTPTATSNAVEDLDEPRMTNLNYSLNYFLAVKTASGCPDPFWIARTLRVEDVDDEGNAVNLKVRWYQAKETTHAFKSTYTMSTYVKEGARTPFDDVIDVRSILCEFASLTRQGALHVRSQKAIRQTLNLH